jgi:hypothetical protein
MTKYKGKVGHSDLEGGYLTLEGDDGTTYKLDGDIQGLAKGQKVEIDGKIETVMGIGFGTPTLKVRAHRAI